MNRVKDKVAIVTGGANGIGQTTCILLAQEAEVKLVFAEIYDQFGKIDVLVNNAGISGVESLPTR